MLKEIGETIEDRDRIRQERGAAKAEHDRQCQIERQELQDIIDAKTAATQELTMINDDIRRAREERRTAEVDYRARIVGLQDKPRQSFRYVFGLLSRPYRLIVTL